MVHVLFDISVISKGVDGALEIVGGALLYLVSPAHLHSLVRMLTQHELSEDPNDFLAGYLLQAAQHLSTDECVPPFTRGVLGHEIGLILGHALRPLVYDHS
jgi:uncharacterized membrane protein